jgi:hypothetical protein
MGEFQIPRGPVVMSEKSGNVDYPDKYKSSIMQWREAARDEAIATAQLHPEYSETQKYIDFLEGRQSAPGRPAYKSRFFDNRMGEARYDNLSVLTDIRPTIAVRSEVEAYAKQAKIAERVIQGSWQKEHFDLALVSAVDHALLGTGYWKIGACMPGKMIVTPCGMDSVLPIQPGRTIQASAAVLYRTYKGIQYYQSIWPDKSIGLEREAVATNLSMSNNQYVRPGHITEVTWSALSPQMRYHLGVRSVRKPASSKSVFPVIQLEEYWIDDPDINDSPNTLLVRDPGIKMSEHNYWYYVKPRQRVWPRKRLLVMAGDRIMYDGPAPYWHGMYPFAQLSLNPVVWAPGGLSKYRSQIPLNQAINEIGGSSMDVIRKALNPPVMTRENAVRPASWKAFYPDKPGEKLRMTSISNPATDVRFMDPPVLPPYVYAMLAQYLIPTFDRRSGRMDVGALGRKNQVPGGDTIEQMRDTLQTSFRLEARFIEAFLMDAGTIAVSNIFQFYTAKQRLWTLGADGMTWEDFDYDPGTMVPATMPKEDHWKLFPIAIAQGSLHGASKDRAKQISISLFRLGAISRRELLRTLEIQNIDEIEAEIAEERQGGMVPMATGKGEVPRLTRSSRTGNPF